MKLSEYIAHLQRLQAEHGDLDVDSNGYDGARTVAPPPQIAYRKVLKGRESRLEYYREYMDRTEPERKGAKVVRV